MIRVLLILALAGCSLPHEEIISPRNGVISTALHEIGLHEDRNREELKDFLGIDPVQYEWCAAFVNAVLDKNNIPGSDSVSAFPLTARSFLLWGESTDVPQRGDIVVFPRGNSGWQGHVGFYIKTENVRGIDYYVILGGNQQDSVTFEYYPADKAISVRRLTQEI